jgi:hypothetical protein
MVEVAAHLTDHVLPPLPVRQWVFSLPKRIRPFLPNDPCLAGDMLRVLLRAIRTTLRRASPSAPSDARLGAVSFLHRFGSALNTHFHFHVVVLDGVFSEGDDGSVTFHHATHLSADDVLRLERTLQRRGLRLFQRRGLLDEHTVEEMLTWQASGGFSLGVWNSYPWLCGERVTPSASRVEARHRCVCEGLRLGQRTYRSAKPGCRCSSRQRQLIWPCRLKP